MIRWEVRPIAPRRPHGVNRERQAGEKQVLKELCCTELAEAGPKNPSGKYPGNPRPFFTGLLIITDFREAITVI